MAVTHDFLIEQGSDFYITFIYQDAAGNRVDISDGKVALRFRGNDSETIYEFLRGDVYNNYITSGDVGEINIFFPASETQGFTFDTAVYDLDFQPNVTSGKQLNTRIATGNISLIKKNFNEFLDSSTGETTPGDDSSNIINPIGGEGNQCDSALSCIELDLYSIVYDGDPIVINDNQNNSGIIASVQDVREIDSIEVVVNNLKHPSPQDLTLILAPPSGDMILLSSHNKISNYSPEVDTNGFSFIFSTRGNSNVFLNNVQDKGFCRIDDKTDIIKFGSNNLLSSFSHLRGHAVTGDYVLYINDDDYLDSGSIDSWNLIITYV